MANSDAKSDRYLIIGYREVENKFSVISINRRNRDDFFNILSTAARNGSVNTPVNDVAPETQIADMWRERFGLTLSPKERLNIYVHDYKNWRQAYSEPDELIVWHYEPFPEFTMEYTIPNNMREYSNPPERTRYTVAHTIGNSYETRIRYKYHTTILEDEILLLCDKYRYEILHSHVDCLYCNPQNLEDIRNSFEYYVQKILNSRRAHVYDIYTSYSYCDGSNFQGKQNEDITRPHQIYLLEANEDIAARLRAEFKKLQVKTAVQEVP